MRVARGKQDEKAGGSTWEQAVAGLPLATGFNLVTGTGRAEIEFEDASTVYLAENSALTFNDIHTTGGVPFTVIALLSGTATMCVQPEFPTEEFEVKTPTGSVSAAYPNETFVRITGFVDGKTLKFLRDTTVYLLGSTRPGYMGIEASRDSTAGAVGDVAGFRAKRADSRPYGHGRTRDVLSVRALWNLLGAG